MLFIAYVILLYSDIDVLATYPDEKRSTIALTLTYEVGSLI